MRRFIGRVCPALCLLLLLCFGGDLYIYLDYRSRHDPVTSILLDLGSYLCLFFTSGFILVPSLVFVPFQNPDSSYCVIDTASISYNDYTLIY